MSANRSAQPDGMRSSEHGDAGRSADSGGEKPLCVGSAL